MRCRNTCRMNNCFFKPHPFRLGAWLLVLGVSLAFGGEDPYLPKVGPVALRFQRGVVRTTGSPVTRVDACPCEGAAAQPVAVQTEITPTLAVPPVPTPETHLVAESPVLVSSSATPVMPTVAPGSATDLLSVNPQMFVDYFKPAPGGTNSVIAIPVPVGFVPPLPPSPGSRAGYRSQ